MKCRILIAVLALGCHREPSRATGQTKLTSAEAPVTAPLIVNGPDIAGLASRVSPSVVNITATQELRLPPGTTDPFDFFFGQPSDRPGRGAPRDESIKRRALGSGFILDTEHVITNAHVVEHATTVRVTLSDEREFDATVKARDERLDVAVLKLRGVKDLPRVTLGKSDDLRVGESVVAIGNPFGLGNTVTMGIVSAKGRELGAGPYDDFIQTDASINPGNSGGPLFNVRGEVVGISTAISAAGQGIGFAIPIDALKDVLDELLAKGLVSRGKLGVAVQSVDEPLARTLGLGAPGGALIAEVEPGSSAARAGIKAGEVVLGVDQAAVAHAHDLPRLVARRAPGTRVTLKVMGSRGKTRTVEATLDELRERREPLLPSAPSTSARGDFGLDLGDDPAGVIVRGIDPGSPAADVLEPGDVIVEVDGATVKSAREATNRLRETRSDRPLLVRVERGGRALFVAIERTPTP